MSGTNNGPPWNVATDAQVASASVLLAAVQPSGVGGNTGATTIAYSVTPQQIAALITTGTFVGQETTVGAVSTTFAGLPAIPLVSGGGVTLKGSITALDASTGAMIRWEFAFDVSRAANIATCTVIPDAAGNPPVCALASGSAELLGLPTPTLGANSSGPIISTQGAANLTLLWGLNINVLESFP